MLAHPLRTRFAGRPRTQRLGGRDHRGRLPGGAGAEAPFGNGYHRDRLCSRRPIDRVGAGAEAPFLSAYSSRFILFTSAPQIRRGPVILRRTDAWAPAASPTRIIDRRHHHRRRGWAAAVRRSFTGPRRAAANNATPSTKTSATNRSIETSSIRVNRSSQAGPVILRRTGAWAPAASSTRNIERRHHHRRRGWAAAVRRSFTGSRRAVPNDAY